MPKPKSPRPVLATKHKDKRANIPTEELRDCVADDEKAPKNILYLRDPSRDPQLVWQGKDEQDRAPLEVPAVPIYIQEKFIPRSSLKTCARRPRRTRRNCLLNCSAISTASSSSSSLNSTSTRTA